MIHLRNLCVFAMVGLGFFLTQSTSVHAQEGGFSVQVTPSPLVATVEPGKESVLELRINNTGPEVESFTMGLKGFSIDSATGDVNLSNDSPKDVAQFIRFENQQFSLKPGEWINQRVYVNMPEESGFSYNFAIIVERDKQSSSAEAGASIKGSVAVFTLLNVNKPGATKALELTQFVSKKKIYEYLPTELQMTVTSTGNTIVAPKGNIFISRGEDDAEPIDVLQINDEGGYILPGVSRSLVVNWGNGFPAREEINGAQKLNWDFTNLSKFRIGKYTAKAVLIYDDGTRDVPIEGVVTFWVIPWKLILGALVLLTLIVVGATTTIKKSSGLIKKKPVEEK